jgi:hypothetical protein
MRMKNFGLMMLQSLGVGWSHVEYGQGFLLYNRPDGVKEVWRRMSDYKEEELPKTNGPDQMQRYHQAASQMHPRFDTYKNSTRGAFMPWACFQTPTTARAYKFTYPNLLIAARFEAYLYDVLSGKLVLTVEPIQDGNMNLSYVDFDHRHIFICLDDELRVYSRKDGRRLIIYTTEDFCQDMSLHATWGVPMGEKPRKESILIREPVTKIATDSRYSMILPTQFHAGEVGASFKAIVSLMTIPVHVSECGQHIAVLMTDNRVVLVEDFARTLRGATVRSIATSIVFGSLQVDSSLYLAYAHGRVGVATVRLSHLPFFCVCSLLLSAFWDLCHHTQSELSPSTQSHSTRPLDGIVPLPPGSQRFGLRRR